MSKVMQDGSWPSLSLTQTNILGKFFLIEFLGCDFSAFLGYDFPDQIVFLDCGEIQLQSS